MQESELIVRRIREGTVIDHIEAGRGLAVLGALQITGSDGGLITIALNVPSGKYQKKDIIKMESRFLREDDASKLAVISPKATMNTIKNYQLVEKNRVSLPDQIRRIIRCSNPDCITNSPEDIEPIMDVITKDKMVLKCRYCGRMLDTGRLHFRP